VQSVLLDLSYRPQNCRSNCWTQQLYILKPFVSTQVPSGDHYTAIMVRVL